MHGYAPRGKVFLPLFLCYLPNIYILFILSAHKNPLETKIIMNLIHHFMRWRWCSLAVCLFTLSIAHTSASAADSSTDSSTTLSTSPTTRSFTLLHMSDMEAALLPPVEESGRGQLGIGRALSVMKGLRKRYPNALPLSVGDTILPAPELSIELDKQNAVVEAHKRLGFVASAIGNHEFDQGELFLADIIKNSAFPYISSTIRIHGGPLKEISAFDDGVMRNEKGHRRVPWIHEVKGRIVPRAKVCLGKDGVVNPPSNDNAACKGIVVGLVGTTTGELRTLTRVSNQVETLDTFEHTTAAVQAQIDVLSKHQIDIIVVLSHLQDVKNEVILAKTLRNADVVLSGGSENLLINAGQRLLQGDHIDPLCKDTRVAADRCYPLLLKSANGAPVVVAATEGKYRYIGAIPMGFDDKGILSSVGFDARPWPVDDVSLLELDSPLDEGSLAFEQRVEKELAPLMIPLVETSVYLDGVRENVRNHETNLGLLSADAMFWAATHSENTKNTKRPLFALRNGGGIRQPIGILRDADAAGISKKSTVPIRLIDVKSSLRFDNRIAVVTTTHAILRETLESALRGAGNNRGHFPQVSSQVYLEYLDNVPEQTHDVQDGRIRSVVCPGQKVWTLRIDVGGSMLSIVEKGVVLNPEANISFAVLEYLAAGGDGYFPARAPLAIDAIVHVDKKPATEQSSLRGYLDFLVAKGEWNEGLRYPNPVVGDSKTFRHIRALGNSVPAPLPLPMCVP